MMKWFRAHTKQIMVAVVLLAMFSFIGSSALVSFLQPNPANDVFARAFGQTVKQGEIQLAQRDIEIIDKMFPVQQENRAQGGASWQFGQRDLTVHHWYLLTKEAERAGIVVPDEELNEMLGNFSADTLEFFRSMYHYTPPEIRHAIRRQLMIRKFAEPVSIAAAPSEPQLRHYVADTENKVRVRFVALDAQKWEEKDEAITPDELQKQFDKYKDSFPGESPEGFGYRHPRRVKVQYIAASIGKIQPQIEVSDDAVKAWWKANKGKYKKTVYKTPPATSAPATTNPDAMGPPVPTASQPAPAAEQVEKLYSEAKPDVERELRQKNATQAAEQAMRKAASLLQKPWLDEKTDPDTGFKPVPAAAKAMDAMKSVSDRAAKEYKIPLDYGETELVSQPELAATALLRNAILAGEGKEGLGLAEYAFRVPPFYKREAGTEAGSCLQLFQAPDTPLSARGPQFAQFQMQSGLQRLVLFRVVESREAESPAKLDDVKAAVERDARLVRAFNRAEPAAKELYTAAMRLGVESAFGLFDDLKSKYGVKPPVSPAPFSRLTRLPPDKLGEALESGKSALTASNVLGVGQSEEFVNACFEMAQEGWKATPMELPDTPRSKQATTRPATAPTPVVRLLSVPRLHRWFVVELLGEDRVDESKYETQYRPMAYFYMIRERSGVLQKDWFKPAHIEARTGYERVKEAAPTGPREGIKAPQPVHPLLDGVS